ncbi:MAG: hypothetical protein BIFFINMI_01338 [Phycisphaerae bacterium]|nr:hypothetical protein [Phycisphaerae bacterium]
MQKLLTQLTTTIEDLARLHGELADAVAQQREAMRKADPAAMESSGGHIQKLVNRICELELHRRQQCERLSEGLGLDGPQADGLRVRDLARRLGGPSGTKLSQAADRLAHRLDDVSRAQRVNHRVAERMRDFFGQLFGEIARVGRETGCYDGTGRRAISRQPITPGCFSAVG